MRDKRNRQPYSYEFVLNKATEMFNNDKNKALAWYMEKVPRYGNKSPYQICKEGKFKQVLKDLEFYDSV